MVVVPGPFREKDTLCEDSPESRPSVEATGLGKVYGGTVVAAKNISLYANVGEIVGLVGPNGAGKSTTLKMLATLIRPTEGSATICGFSIRDRHRVRAMMGVALQDVGLDPLMTGQEHLKIQAALCGFSFDRVRNQAAKLVDRFSLESYMERYVGAYSGGTQRRLALVLALLTDPEVIIFDEPTAGLDPRARRDLWNIVNDLKNANRTIIFSTQYLEEADALCDRVYFIDRGSIVADGSPESLKRAVGDPTLQITLDRATGPLILDVLGALPIQISEVGGFDLSVKLDESRVRPTKVLQAIEDRGMGIKGFKLVPPSLDDVFFHYTQRTLEPEPLEKTGMDLGTRAHRGGGKRWK
jgi:ABC-type multidrug transport system ATPase subunit